MNLTVNREEGFLSFSSSSLICATICKHKSLWAMNLSLKKKNKTTAKENVTI